MIHINLKYPIIQYAAPGDYTSNSTVLTFTPGQTSAMINIQIMDDDVVEDVLETFLVQAMLVSTDAAGVTISPSQATISINDSDGNSIVIV